MSAAAADGFEMEFLSGRPIWGKPSVAAAKLKPKEFAPSKHRLGVGNFGRDCNVLDWGIPRRATLDRPPGHGLRQALCRLLLRFPRQGKAGALSNAGPAAPVSLSVGICKPAIGSRGATSPTLGIICRGPSAHAQRGALPRRYKERRPVNSSATSLAS